MKSPPRIDIEPTGLRAVDDGQDKYGRMVDFDKRCAKCGGLAEVERYPKHAAGCRCAHTKRVKAQKKAIQKMLTAKRIDPETMSRLLRGEWTPEK